MNKFGIFFHESFDIDIHRIKKIFILKKGEVATITKKQLTDTEAFLKLRKMFTGTFLPTPMS